MKYDIHPPYSDYPPANHVQPVQPFVHSHRYLPRNFPTYAANEDRARDPLQEQTSMVHNKRESRKP